MTHALSGDHPLVKIISKPRGTPLEQATVTPVGDRIEIKATSRILSAGDAIRPSLYLLSSKNKYDSLVLRVAYRLNGHLQDVSRTFTTQVADSAAPPGQDVPPFQLPALPIAFDSINYINWYGNTNFAYQNRTTIYSALQGLHSGIDFIAPYGTPIKSVVNRSGAVVSINNEPYDYRTGPGNLLIDYGEFLVLYGHIQNAHFPDAIKIGAVVVPNDTIAYVGADTAGLIHLHLEIIRKNPPASGAPGGRPGYIRTNPVPFFSSNTLDQLTQKAQGIGATFHPIPSVTKWQTPNDQPDIIPGGPLLVP